MLVMKDGELCSAGLWDVFCTLLDSRIDELGCGCGEGKSELKRSFEVLDLLSREGLPVDVPATLARFEKLGGYCDVEVLWNVDGAEERDKAQKKTA